LPRQPFDELGEHMTAGDAVGDVVTAGVFGGLLGGGFHIAGEHVPPALFKVMPESVQRRWADKMKVGGGKDAPLLKDVSATWTIASSRVSRDRRSASA
jgi:hypothetical protein